MLGHGQRGDDLVQRGRATLGRNGEGQQQGGIVIVNGVHGEPLRSWRFKGGSTGSYCILICGTAPLIRHGIVLDFEIEPKMGA